MRSAVPVPLFHGRTDRSKVGIENAATLMPLPESKTKTLLLSSIMMTIQSPNLYPSSALCAQYAVPHFVYPGQLQKTKQEVICNFVENICER